MASKYGIAETEIQHNFESDSDLDLCDLELLSDKQLKHPGVPRVHVGVHGERSECGTEESEGDLELQDELEREAALSLPSLDGSQDSDVIIVGCQSAIGSNSLGFMPVPDLPSSPEPDLSYLPDERCTVEADEDSMVSSMSRSNDAILETTCKDGSTRQEVDADVDRLAVNYPNMDRHYLTGLLTDLRKTSTNSKEAYQHAINLLSDTDSLEDNQSAQPHLPFCSAIQISDNDSELADYDDSEHHTSYGKLAGYDDSEHHKDQGELLDYDDEMESMNADGYEEVTSTENYAGKIKKATVSPSRYFPYSGKGKRPLLSSRSTQEGSGKPYHKSSTSRIPTDVTDSARPNIPGHVTSPKEKRQEPTMGQVVKPDTTMGQIVKPDTTMRQIVKPDVSVVDVTVTHSPILCEACEDQRSKNSVVQCCDSHLVCTHCVEKAAKVVLVGDQKGSVICPVPSCNSSVPQSELRKALPSIVLDLLEEKWKKETLEALGNMKDGVTCPGCGYAAVLDLHIKRLMCSNCGKSYCRQCEMEWHQRQHDLCIKTTTKISTDTGAIIQIPSHWIDATDRDGYSEVDLDNASEEFLEISILFINSMHQSGCNIQKIYRIQNQRLWEKYSLLRTHMVEDLGELHINEQRLFHGTQTDVIHPICKEGFDWRLSGKHGTMFGQGTYFAKDASYSHNYSTRGQSGRSTGTLLSGTVSGFSLGGNSNSNTGFSFGTSSQPTTNSNTVTGFFGTSSQSTTNSNTVTGFAFGNQQPSSNSNTGFSFGSQQPSSNSNTGFGFGSQQPSSNSNTAFSYGMQQPSSNANTGFSFGSQQPSSNANTGFGFGSQQPSSNSNTGFSFGMQQPSSNANTGFSFGSQQPSSNSNTGFAFGNQQANPNAGFLLGKDMKSLSYNLGNGYCVTSGGFVAPTNISASTGSNLFVKVLPPTGSSAYHRRDPSSEDPSSNKLMFVGRVLVGRACKGRSEMRRPEKDAHDPEGKMCHSAVDNVNSPRIFVIFESSQCYPEYLIEYT